MTTYYYRILFPPILEVGVGSYTFAANDLDDLRKQVQRFIDYHSTANRPSGKVRLEPSDSYPLYATFSVADDPLATLEIQGPFPVGQPSQEANYVVVAQFRLPMSPSQLGEAMEAVRDIYGSTGMRVTAQEWTTIGDHHKTWLVVERTREPGDG